MSLYGALFGAVSGLNAQSSKIGAISDNIANSNTIGYKEANSNFQSLVVNTSNAGSYQTGGVRASTSLAVDKQGLLQSTNSATDLAISGGGFFVVRQAATATSTPLYTRAGGFTQDEVGNFVNSSGFFLQGWPLDREGRLPGEPGNLNTTSFTNFDSLETVNVQSASGTAQSTSAVSLGANLNANEVVFPGQAQSFGPSSSILNNRNQPADAIMVGHEYGLDGASGDGLNRGDIFNISLNSNQPSSFGYGGFAVSRDLTNANVTTNPNFGDSGTNNKAVFTLAGADVVSTSPGGVYTIHIANHDLIDGDSITLAGLPAVGTTPANQLNTSHTVTWVDKDHVSFTVATDSGTNGLAAASGGTADTRRFSATGIALDAGSTTALFLGNTGTGGYSAAALTFTINTSSSGLKTFTYTSGTTNAANGEFNNLTTLASAINTVDGLSARVVAGRLVVASENASEAVAFANGDDVGDTTAGTFRGLDWVKELGLADVAASNGTPRFASLQGLADAINNTTGMSATVNNPLAASTLTINADDPTGTIQFLDNPPAQDISGANTLRVMNSAGTIPAGTAINIQINEVPPAGLTANVSQVYLSGISSLAASGITGIIPNGGPYLVTSINAGTSYTISIPAPEEMTLGAAANYSPTAGAQVSVANSTNQGSILSAFGVTDSFVGVPYSDVSLGFGSSSPQETAVLGPRYQSDDATKNMASGSITAQFSRNVEVFDGLGSGHNIRFSFLKLSSNEWAVEVHAIPPTDVTTSLPNGQLAAGNITFNGDGTLHTVDAGLLAPLSVQWTNGSVASTVNLDLGTAGIPAGTGNGTIGLADGLSQFASDYNVNFANQNGAAVGQLVSVAVDDRGVVVASYSNGQTKELFQLPLAAFANPDGLLAVTGNVFSQTRDSGEVNLRQAQSNGTGTVVSSTLEQSNVDLATQLTDMIVAQRAYQANTQVIKVTDQLLDQLNQI